MYLHLFFRDYLGISAPTVAIFSAPTLSCRFYFVHVRFCVSRGFEVEFFFRLRVMQLSLGYKILKPSSLFCTLTCVITSLLLGMIYCVHVLSHNPGAQLLLSRIAPNTLSRNDGNRAFFVSGNLMQNTRMRVFCPGMSRRNSHFKMWHICVSGNIYLEILHYVFLFISLNSNTILCLMPAGV